MLSSPSAAAICNGVSPALELQMSKRAPQFNNIRAQSRLRSSTARCKAVFPSFVAASTSTPLTKSSLKMST
ncbi:hypothetical protein HanRHA438_Chr13g0594051 [Helianthus annuus]|nr:hypothetical protein HanIR_Chr13g0635121 [Helianthus annuus]KAJ0857783.1 hypothetical protein HanRHA438_Chr13g0594051 [Helianthus annuus]